jgi:LPXTG-motif cell wall-anchored protein
VFSHFGGAHAFALTLIPLALLMLSLWFLRRRLVA